MSVTVRDIAKKMNVSHMMVARALSADKCSQVAPQKREMIVRVAQEMGYEPNNAAKTLATGKSGFVALQVYDMESAHTQTVARRLWEMLKLDGYVLVVHEVANDVSRLRTMVDGTIMLAPGDLSQFSRQSAIVELGTRALDDVDSVFVDVKEAALQAMTLLIQSGRRRIALISSAPDDPLDGRSAAYAQAMSKAGLPPMHVRLQVNRSRAGRDALANCLTQVKPPDAIFCQNDLIAAGCYRALREAGLAIPNDVAVVGCDGIEIGEFLDPPLTTIEQPVEEMCKSAWQMLRNRIADASIGRQHVTLKARFLARDSC